MYRSFCDLFLPLIIDTATVRSEGGFVDTINRISVRRSASSSIVNTCNYGARFIQTVSCANGCVPTFDTQKIRGWHSHDVCSAYCNSPYNTRNVCIRESCAPCLNYHKFLTSFPPKCTGRRLPRWWYFFVWGTNYVSQKVPGFLSRRRFGAPWVRSGWTECYRLLLRASFAEIARCSSEEAPRQVWTLSIVRNSKY
jgi:hypothetical protein